MSVVAAPPARPKPPAGSGGPERLDFNLGQNGDYRFDYATGEFNTFWWMFLNFKFRSNFDLK
jgi:hypothetical protein